MRYIVKRGETWQSVSGDYRVPVEDLWMANPFVSHSTLKPGQVIIIPNLPDKELFLTRSTCLLLKSSLNYEEIISYKKSIPLQQEKC